MIRAKKSLGQNFLIDQNIINKIVNIVDIKDKNVLEIVKCYGVLKKLNLGQDATQRDIAAGVLKQMSATKLRKKPMLGKEVGYMLNVKKDFLSKIMFQF